MKYVYVWIDPPDSLGREALKLIAGKAAYLNKTGFILRTVIYFVLAIFISQRLYGWSLKQDATGDVMLLQKQRSLGAGGLPFIALALTFARVRLADEPEPDLVLDGVRRLLLRRQHRCGALAAGDHHQARAGGERVRREHERRAHAQHRQADAGVRLLLDLHRVLPADAHLDRRAPRRDAVLHHPLQPGLALDRRASDLRALLHPVRRAAVAVAQAQPGKAGQGGGLDPLHPPRRHLLAGDAEPRPEGFALRWTDVTAFLGVGLVGIAFGVSRLRGKLPVPVKDPYIAESIRYRQP